MKNFLFGLLFVFSISPAQAAVDIPFTITMTEAVVVTGVPRIELNVGGAVRYANYTSGSGGSALIFTYSLQSGDVDADGVVLTSPIQLNGGTIKDLQGNDSDLTFVVPNTSGVIVNGAVPSGYSVVFGDDTVTNVNKTALSFVITSPKINRTYTYSITSSGGGTPVTGTGILTSSPQTVGGINVTGLPDGLLTLSVTLTDSIGGVGAAVTDTIPMAVLTANLIGHWTFDANDISGTTAYDRSGNGNNGVMTNGPTPIAGMTGGALGFDGGNDYVAVTTASTISAPYTISAWALTNLATSVNAVAGSRGPSDTSFDFKFQNGNRIHGDIGTGSSWITTSADATFNYSTAVWYHIAYVVSSTGYTIYANGAPVATSTYASTTPLLLNATHILNFGRAGNVGEYLNGKIDDVRVYNAALTSGDISSLYSVH